jgi:uncharacterized protein (TIGR02145 family)
MSKIRYTLLFLISFLSQLSFIAAQIPDIEQTLVVEVKSKTGRIWMDRNLGATQVANSSLHSTSFGHLYQWGRFTDGHQLRSSKTSKKLIASNSSDNSAFILSIKSPNDWLKAQNANLWQGATGVNNPCPVGFRLPTSAEFEEEIATWVSKNAKGAFLSPLKLPLTGYRSNGDGQVTDSGFSGDYWTSTVEGKNARGLYFDSETAATDGGGRAVGVSVRCIKN